MKTTLYKDDLVTVTAQPIPGFIRREIEQRNGMTITHDFRGCSVRRDQFGVPYIGGMSAPDRDSWRDYVTVDDAGFDLESLEEERCLFIVQTMTRYRLPSMQVLPKRC